MKKNQQNFFLFFFCVGLCHNNKKAVTYQSKLLISTVKTSQHKPTTTNTVWWNLIRWFKKYQKWNITATLSQKKNSKHPLPTTRPSSLNVNPAAAENKRINTSNDTPAIQSSVVFISEIYYIKVSQQHSVRDDIRVVVQPGWLCVCFCDEYWTVESTRPFRFLHKN